MMKYKNLKMALDYWNCLPSGLSEKQAKFFGVILKAASIYEGILKKKETDAKKPRKDKT